jgi:hypothetical protein
MASIYSLIVVGMTILTLPFFNPFPGYSLSSFLSNGYLPLPQKDNFFRGFALHSRIARKKN